MLVSFFTEPKTTKSGERQPELSEWKLDHHGDLYTGADQR